MGTFVHRYGVQINKMATAARIRLNEKRGYSSENHNKALSTCHQSRRRAAHRRDSSTPHSPNIADSKIKLEPRESQQENGKWRKSKRDASVNQKVNIIEHINNNNPTVSLRTSSS